MKTLSQLQDFFYDEVYPSLGFLEKKRVKIFSELKTWAIGIFLGTLFLAFLTKDMLLNSSIDFAGVFFAAPIALFGIIYKIKTKDFVLDYKDQLIEQIVSFVDAGLSYSKSSSISEYEYKTSALFPQSYDRYKGDDFVSGKVDGVSIKFSEVHTQKKKKSKNSTYWVDIFQGLLFIADFHKHFKSKTVVLPDRSEALMGSFSHFFQSFSSRGELIKMDDPNFEKEFVVYGDDQIEARYILSPSLMENIMEYKNRVQKPLYFSFVGSKIYVAIDFSAELFEPKIYKKVTSFEEIKVYFQTLSMVIDIVKSLNLDRRIWSKV